MWLLAECTVHVEMSSKRRWRGGGSYQHRRQERGSVKCSEVGTGLRKEESAVTRLLDGHLDMFFFNFVIELCYFWLTCYPTS